MNDNESTSHTDEQPDRRTLIRDVAVFQVKLVFDGLRDLLLVPVSLGAGLISLLSGGPKPGPEFYDLLKLGRRSEKWINLFGAASHWHGPPTDNDQFDVDDVDEMVAKIERFVVTEYKAGGVTAQAKSRLDQAMESLTKIAHRKKEP